MPSLLFGDQTQKAISVNINDWIRWKQVHGRRTDKYEIVRNQLSTFADTTFYLPWESSVDIATHFTDFTDIPLYTYFIYPQGYGRVFCHKIHTKHTLAKNYFSRLPGMAEHLHNKANQPKPGHSITAKAVTPTKA